MILSSTNIFVNFSKCKQRKQGKKNPICLNPKCTNFNLSNEKLKSCIHWYLMFCSLTLFILWETVRRYWNSFWFVIMLSLRWKSKVSILFFFSPAHLSKVPSSTERSKKKLPFLIRFECQQDLQMGKDLKKAGQCKLELFFYLGNLFNLRNKFVRQPNLVEHPKSQQKVTNIRKHTWLWESKCSDLLIRYFCPQVMGYLFPFYYRVKKWKPKFRPPLNLTEYYEWIWIPDRIDSLQLFRA